MKIWTFIFLVIFSGNSYASTMDFYLDCDGSTQNCVELMHNGKKIPLRKVDFFIGKSDLVSAKLGSDGLSSTPVLVMKLSPEKGEIFREITGSLIEKVLYIVVGEQVVSNPIVMAAIGSDLSLTMNLETEEAVKENLSWLYERAYSKTKEIEIGNSLALIFLLSICFGAVALLVGLKVKKVI